MFPFHERKSYADVKGYGFEYLLIFAFIVGVLLMAGSCTMEKVPAGKKVKAQTEKMESNSTSAAAEELNKNVSDNPMNKEAMKELREEISHALASGEGPHVLKFKNGLTLLIKNDDRFPLVNVRLFVHAGSSYEDPSQAGISHLLEHMVFKGTEKRAPGQTALEVESVGGDMNAATSFDYTVYYVEVPDNQWQLGMDIVTDMAFNAKIDPKELVSEKEVVLSELARGEDNPGSRIFKTLQSMVWNGTSYQWPIIGYRDTVKKITSDDIHAYIKRLYQPQSMLLSVVGKIDPEKVVEEARKLCGQLQDSRPVVPPVEFSLSTPDAPQAKVIKGNWNKAYIGAAFPVPGLGSAKTVGLETLCDLLGGGETSRLYRKFKYEKGIVDSISVSSLTLERGGMLYIYAVLDPDKVNEFWAELMQELADVDMNSFSDREMDRVLLNLEDSLFLTKETLSGLASKLGYFQFFEGGQQAEENYLYNIKHIERSQLQKLYKEFFRPEKLSACVLVPEDSKISAESLKQDVLKYWPDKKEERKNLTSMDTGKKGSIHLPGGSEVIFIPDTTLPYTAMSLYWLGGDSDLTPEQQGLSALVSGALIRGTGNMNATELEDFISDRAATLNSSAGRDVFAINAKFPSRFTADMLPLVSDIIIDPAFSEEELNRARMDQVSSIKQREDRPVSLAFRNMFPFLFKDTGFSYFHLGHPSEVMQFSRNDVQNFWKEQSSRPFVLAVCGEYDRDAVIKFAKTLDSHISVQNAVAQERPQWGMEKELTLNLPDRNQAHIMAVFPVPGLEDKKSSAALSLLRATLAGQSGLLFRDLRDKQGLGYTVTAFLWQSSKSGFMAFYIGTKPEQIDQAVDGFKKTVEKLHNSNLPETEIDRAKNILSGEYYQEHQSLISRSRESASLAVRGFSPDRDRTIIETAKKMDAADIRDLVNKYINWDEHYLIKVQP
jgi:zinc protease